jgi:hypothetical protein
MDDTGGNPGNNDRDKVSFLDFLLLEVFLYSIGSAPCS